MEPCSFLPERGEAPGRYIFNIIYMIAAKLAVERQKIQSYSWDMNSFCHKIKLKSRNILLLLTIVFIWSCSKDAFTCNENLGLQENLKLLGQHYITKGLPGLALKVVNENNQSITLAFGMADRENHLPLTTSHLFHSASVAKLYLATCIMLLKEENKLELDEKIATYLSAEILNDIANRNTATVRMLLNHSSGIPDFTKNDQYLSDLEEHLNNPTKTIKPNLDYIRGDKSQFKAGAEFEYSNTNYHLLALIIDYVTGYSHADFISDRIINKLKLSNTYYKNELNYPYPPNLPNYYVDWESNGNLVNAGNIESVLINTTIGINGIIASIEDYYLFAKALYLDQSLITSTSLKEMMESDHIKRSGHGLGQEISLSTKYPDRFGHSGGPQALVAYYPEKQSFILFFMNYSFLEANSPLDIFSNPHENVGTKGNLLGDIERCLFEK